MKKFAMKLDLKRFTFFIICSVVVIFAILQAPVIIDAKEILEFNSDPKNYNVKLQIFDKENKVTEFYVAIADSEEKRIYGLMNLKKLEANNGMLFPLPNKQIATMWMKNTRIPLDMVFIDENNEIAAIHSNATPYSLDLISSEKEVDKVLEINGGLAEKLKIQAGQKVTY